MSTGKDQKKSIEKSLTELERLVEELENGDLELDQALKKFGRSGNENKNPYGKCP